jgi:hypothetical protein
MTLKKKNNPSFNNESDSEPELNINHSLNYDTYFTN